MQIGSPFPSVVFLVLIQLCRSCAADIRCCDGSSDLLDCYHYYLCWLVDSCDVCSGGADPSGGGVTTTMRPRGCSSRRAQDRVGVTVHQL